MTITSALIEGSCSFATVIVATFPWGTEEILAGAPSGKMDGGEDLYAKSDAQPSHEPIGQHPERAG